jgi:ABC-type iron transport system FetAB permease component
MCLGGSSSSTAPQVRNGGVSPLSAVRLQLVVMYRLLGGTAFAALVAAQLTVCRLFTKSHQLIKSPRRIP